MPSFVRHTDKDWYVQVKIEQFYLKGGLKELFHNFYCNELKLQIPKPIRKLNMIATGLTNRGFEWKSFEEEYIRCLLYTSPSPRD